MIIKNDEALQTRRFWELSEDVRRFKRMTEVDPDDIADVIDELEVLAMYAASTRLRAVIEDLLADCRGGLGAMRPGAVR